MPKDTLDPKPNQSAHIENMICFAIYSASTAMNRAYQPYLSKLGLTYPQFITLSVLLHGDGATVGSLCRSLKMETNTLTPILQRLEKQELITRERGRKDERQVIVRLTTEGQSMMEKQQDIVNCIIADTDFDRSTLDDLIASTTELRDNLNENIS